MDFYKTQGTLPLEALSYVERKADQELLQALCGGRFSHVLSSRQMGKSSLMVRTAERLRQRHVQVAQIDLQAIGVNLTPEQWYDGLLLKLGRQVGMADRLEQFWLDHQRLGPVQRLFTALREQILPRLPVARSDEDGALPKLVIFIDEIEIIRSLSFSCDEFFAAIRESYNARISDPAWRNVTFAVLGVALPRELIRDPSVTLFDLGEGIELTDFTLEESLRLSQGLGCAPRTADKLLQRVFHWTHGHPYLTQRLCQALAASPHFDKPSDVDRLCEELFLGRRASDHDENLLFVRERLLRSGDQRLQAIRLYEEVHHRRGVADDRKDPRVNTLCLSGIVRPQNGLLTVRNRIYYNVFDKEWIRHTLRAMGDTPSHTIAVLPFVDLGAKANPYLGDGLTDELISALGHIPALRVASRTSTFRFKGQDVDPPEIGRQLGVAFLLEGSVRQLGESLEVSARLLSSNDSKILWTAEFSQSEDEMHRIREEIAQSIVDQLRPHLGVAASPAGARRSRPPEREAYHLYLKGRHHWNRRHEASLSQSVTFFQQAIERDPEYAAAHAGLAEAYLILGIYSFRPPHEVHPRAKEAAIRALDIDDHLADAHAAIACVYSVYDWDWVRAETSFRRSIDLNPSCANAHLWYGINCLSPLARHDESLDELRIAQELDPLSLRIAASIGLALHLASRNEEAVAQCRYTIELDEGYWLTHLFLGNAQMALHRFTEARPAFQTAVDLSQGNPDALTALAQCHALEGRYPDAERILNGLLNLMRSRYVPAGDIACIYATLRRPDLARQWMQRAQEERSFRLIYGRVDPRFRSFQSDTP